MIFPGYIVDLGLMKDTCTYCMVSTTSAVVSRNNKIRLECNLTNVYVSKSSINLRKQCIYIYLFIHLLSRW